MLSKHLNITALRKIFNTFIVENKSIDKAEKKLLQLNQEYPNNTILHNKVFFSIYKDIDQEVAIKYAEEVLKHELDPKFIKVLATRYIVLKNEKRYRELMDLYFQVVLSSIEDKNIKIIIENKLSEINNDKETLKKELYDYKASRLKYKRLYEKFYARYQTNDSLILDLKNKVYKREMEFNRKIVFDNFKIKKFNIDSKNTATTLIFADLNLNVVDGSSIWLSSVNNLFNSLGNVIILSKFNIEKTLIISNFINTKFENLILEPKDLGLDNGLTLSDVSKALVYIDEVSPNIQNLLVRGTEAIEEIIKNNNFKGRLIPYITNFYTQTEDEILISKNNIELLYKISHQTKIWLWQTNFMKNFIESKINFNFTNYILFPPILPDYNNLILKFKTKEKRENILIGYSGKIQPDWGVLELLKETEKLILKGKKLKVRIVTSKISHSSVIKSGKGFVEEVKKYLKKDFVEVFYNVNRDKAISLISDVDYIWSYREASFEESTLELSTKLLEGAALGIPIISYPSEIHRKVLGNNYPYYLHKIDDLEKLLDNKEDFDLFSLSLSIQNKYSLETRIQTCSHLINKVNNKVVLLASNDFKFLDHFYSYLKEKGFGVYKDYWEWGQADNIARSEYFYGESDIIFCEWGLANAVWYSKNNIDNKPLYIRMHAQEVREKARKFSRQINYNNVEKVIFVSERIRKKALELFDLNLNQTELIKNYVLTDDFKYYHKDKIGLNFGMVGITPHSKRLDRALDLMEVVLEKYPEAKLYIKGYRPESLKWMHAPGRVKELDYFHTQYKRIESNILLEKAIIFDGFGNDMPEWYQKIDFILSPSDHESFHYALADGIASGCIPIIWSWEEAAKIYNKKWIINNDNFTSMIYDIIDNRELFDFNESVNLIIKKYGYNKIYNELIKLL